MNDHNIVIGEVTDPVEVRRSARIEAGERNLAWLESHWADFLPQGRGKFLVVAGQEGHIADSAEGAWTSADAAHPEDKGALVQYVRPEIGPRIYAHRRQMASVR